jgi:hypothetical protein
MILNYKPILNLEDIAEDAKEDIKNGHHIASYILAYNISTTNLIHNPLKDVSNDAKDWQSKKRPNDLYFNHGEFINNGIVNIINELKNKKSSNRALFSLIDQSTIEESNDDPIPSFLIFQANIEGNSLYCTIYLRSLEVSSFLRINLEEIRLIIKEISESGINFTDVNLTILCARAHHTKNSNSLKKPKIDTMSQIQILDSLLDKEPSIQELIFEKSKSKYVFSITSLETLNEIISTGRHKTQNNDLASKYLKSSIDLSIELTELRKNNSKSNNISERMNELEKSLINLSEIF